MGSKNRDRANGDECKRKTDDARDRKRGTSKSESDTIKKSESEK
jgi:hypothetical protein